MSLRDEAAPLFSVIIPTYQRAAFLKEAISSVLRQTVPDLECIVVDDGSPEPVRLDERDARVRLVTRATNGGPAAARNSGLEVAKGRYISFLDDDDLYEPDRLAMALDGLHRAPVAVCWRRDLNSRTPAAGRILEGNVHDTILDGMIPSLGQVAVASEITPRFDERFYGAQDLEWWLRLSHGHAVTTTPAAGYIVRPHSGARHRNTTEARIGGSKDLMSLHRDYFDTHPRATAFRWRRIGLMAMQIRDVKTARNAFLRSLRVKPSSRSFYHLVRASLRPGGHAHA